MEDLGIGISVLSHGMPGPELLSGPEADAWASRINDHLAEVMQAHPGKFEAWATLGWHSIDGTIAEIDRCVNQLGFKGVYLFSNINQKTVDIKEFWPVYGHIETLGVPINMHPTAPINMNGTDHRPLVPGMAFMFDTALATVRMVMSGVFQEYPDLKLIVPHTGGFVPYIRGRVGRLIDEWTSPEGWVDLEQSSSLTSTSCTWTLWPTVRQPWNTATKCSGQSGCSTAQTIPSAHRTLRYTMRWWMDSTARSRTEN